VRPRSRHYLLSIALTGALLATCARTQAPLHPPNPPGTWYVVKPGETPARIAAREGVPLEDLLEINGLRRGDALREGQIIFLLDPQALRGTPRGTQAATAAPPAEGPPPAPVADQAPVARGSEPLLWPLRQPRLSSGFGIRQGKVHEGIDLAAPTGTPIHAARAGVVLYAGDAVRGYGNMVVLQHEGDLLTVYAHNSVLLVRTGERVAAGQEIARVGQSGRASAPHLHFEVRKGQVPQDPLRCLPALRR
jgi:murein DD-endopeptidase MepM/ murein hydrolase activator NlpD